MVGGEGAHLLQCGVREAYAGLLLQLAECSGERLLAVLEVAAGEAPALRVDAGVLVALLQQDPAAAIDQDDTNWIVILKDVGPDDLVTIIRRVATGEFLINDKVFAKPAVASRVLKEFRELAVYGAEAQPIFAPLSPREVEILDNIAQGMTTKQVAYALSISEQTVKNHMSSILRKLSVNDRTQAVVYAMRQGWIRMPED